MKSIINLKDIVLYQSETGNKKLGYCMIVKIFG